MPGPVIANIDDVSKRFVIRKDKSLKERLTNFRASNRNKDDFWALRNVSMQLELGSTVGLIGHNGSGKSTLLKTIGGIMQPTSGRITSRGKLAALLELGAGFHPDLTGRDNVFLNASILGLTRKETAAKFDEIVEFSGIEEFIDTQVKFYSSGMYVRLAFSVAVHVDPDLLLVDEVLAVGDEPFQRKCLAKIAEFQRDGRSIVLVSHALAQVRALCDRVVVLEHGVVTHDGDTDVGLDVLRASFETSRQLDLGTVTADPGVGLVSLLGVASSIVPSLSDDTGPDLQIELRVQVNDPAAIWGATYTIVSNGGLTIYEFTSFGLAMKMPRSRGEHTIRATVPNINLGEGEYSVDVSLGLVNGERIAGGMDSGTFAIEKDNHGSGLVRFIPRIVAE